MVSVEQILQSFGPMLSSQLVDKIIEIDKISKVAARKRVSRVITPVNRLRGSNFPNNEKFIYLDDHFVKSQFIENLYLTLVKSNTAAGRALCGLGSRNGAFPTILFPKIAGSTVISKQFQTKPKVS